MDTYKIPVIIEQDEDGIYIASVPSLKGCHTQAESLDELVVRIKEAVELYFEFQQEEFKEQMKLHFVGLQEIEVNA